MTFPEGIKLLPAEAIEKGIKFPGRNILNVMEDKAPSWEIDEQSHDPP